MTSRIDYNDPCKERVGILSLSYHYEMLADQRRLRPFAGAIEELCPEKIVFESGTGSGILSLLAAKAGAARVFCTEIDPGMAAVAQSNFERNGLADRITLLNKNTLDVTPDDTGGYIPDILIAENLSTWQVTEPENEVMNHLRTVLSHDKTLSIPSKAINLVELCESTYSFMGLVEFRAHYFEFSGITPPRLLSAPETFSMFDYSSLVPTHLEGELIIPAAREGVINSLRLTSPLLVSEGYSFESSDSLMPPVVVPLPSDIAVSEGDSLLVKIAYRTNTIWEEFECEAALIG